MGITAEAKLTPVKPARHKSESPIRGTMPNITPAITPVLVTLRINTTTLGPGLAAPARQVKARNQPIIYM